jgi:predicted phosphodiesterase
MRVALISDIHGNLVSLTAVLADIEQAQVDRIVCLGDVAALGPQPRQVLARLKALGCPCVLGNHDNFLLHPDQLHEYMDEPWFEATIEWCLKQLSAGDLAFLRTFQPLIELPLGDDATLLCFHGSPKSNVDVILATTSMTKVNKMLAGYRAVVMAGGHTHVQMMRQHKGIMIVNPGSVGMPFEEALFTGSPRILPWAEYAIVGCLGAVLSVELRRVPINLDAVKEAAFTSGMPEAAEWANNWLTPPGA